MKLPSSQSFVFFVELFRLFFANLSFFILPLSDIHCTALFTPLYCLAFILLLCLPHCILWHSFYCSVYPIALSDIHRIIWITPQRKQKIEKKEASLQIRGELSWSGKISSSCSTSGTAPVVLLLWLRPTEHNHGHLWHRYSVAVRKTFEVMTITEPKGTIGSVAPLLAILI
jgi:hypothetical protein